MLLSAGVRRRGWFWLADLDAVLGAIMLAWPILYLTSRTSPSRLERTPPLGAVLGFAMALVGSLVFK